jgi:hypothetical protein
MTTKGEAAMNANGKLEVVRQFARRGTVLAALLAMVLFGADVTRAQSGATTAPVSTAKPAAAAVTSPTLSVAKPPAKGSHEGITVYGHWTIEIKNPDGTVDKHIEFENNLAPNTLVTGGNALPGGQALLYALLAGGSPFGGTTPVNIWLVNLQGDSAVDTPCNGSFSGYPPILNLSGIPAALQPACILTNTIDENGVAFSVCNLGGIDIIAGQSFALPGCSDNLQAMLSTTPGQTVGGAPIASGFELSGSITAMQPGHISTVSTLTLGGTNQPYEFTTTTLTTPAGCGSGTGQVACGISVAAGQSISVTVAFSFSSPSS